MAVTTLSDARFKTYGFTERNIASLPALAVPVRLRATSRLIPSVETYGFHPALDEELDTPSVDKLIKTPASLKNYSQKDEGEPPTENGRKNPCLSLHGDRKRHATHKETTAKLSDMAPKLAVIHRLTVGTVKNYYINHSSTIHGRTTRHAGYRTSQTIRKRIEEYFGWLKTVSGLRKSRFIGREKFSFHFVLGASAYNLVRVRNLGLSAF